MMQMIRKRLRANRFRKLQNRANDERLVKFHSDLAKQTHDERKQKR
ncbi:hypothetical protein HWB51_gp064 [Mycobacterium phage Cuke]|uniref:Uncharacterized protein n=1 Tax=Mycobacterium phage Cuke TaxID=2079417 RepID=A0A2L1IWZ9_9CAUD|nr:hypothetical protein HWB51_gp064 [Mycobacterium phage Cuke]AVD99682.1 hypothetical protein SEA_CUKE_64 [Mycobacterium phage Cuke]